MLRSSGDVRLLGEARGCGISGGVTVSPRKEHVSPRHRHRAITKATDLRGGASPRSVAGWIESCQGMHEAMSFRAHTVCNVERRTDLAAIGGALDEVGHPPVVLITWQDAWADSEQHERAEWRSDYLVRTTGFLVRDEPDVVSIAQEILPEEDGFRAVTHIPRGMIEDLMCLRGGDDRSASPGTLTSRS
jgi:hypothetical protein